MVWTLPRGRLECDENDVDKTRLGWETRKDKMERKTTKTQKTRNEEEKFVE